jgi:hypothetical protein
MRYFPPTTSSRLAAFRAAQGLEIHGVALHQPVRALARDAEQGGRSRDVPTARPERGDQRRQLDRIRIGSHMARSGHGFGRATRDARLRREHALGQVLGLQRLRVPVQHEQAPHEQHELAHVERPVVHAEPLDEIALDRGHRALRLRRHEPREERQHVLAPVAQGR